MTLHPQQGAVPLKNPISADMSVMRTRLLPGLVSAAQHNLNRQQPRVRLFETGLRFIPAEKGLATQTPTLAMVVTGGRFAESWNSGGDAADFFDLKGDLESLLALGGAADRVSFTAGKHPALHPGQTASISLDGKEVGVIGALHPSVQAKLGIAAPLYLCEIDQAAALGGRLPAFEELSKFPEVRRDLAVIVDQAVPAAELLDKVRGAAGEHLTDVRLFDVYRGKGIDPDRKSLALGMTFRDRSRTLADEDVNQAVDAVVASLKDSYQAELR